MVIAWEAKSQDPDNSKNFNIIAAWWKSLSKKSILWKQRLIPESGEIDWSPQKFDDVFAIMEPEVRGITFYWKKGDTEVTGETTPSNLEFYPVQQRLYIYPETQSNLVISVEIPGAIRETLQLKNPSWFSEHITDADEQVIGYRLIIQDNASQVEVFVEMNAGNLYYLKRSIDAL